MSALRTSAATRRFDAPGSRAAFSALRPCIDSNAVGFMDGGELRQGSVSAGAPQRSRRVGHGPLKGAVGQHMGNNRFANSPPGPSVVVCMQVWKVPLDLHKRHLSSFPRRLRLPLRRRERRFESPSGGASFCRCVEVRAPMRRAPRRPCSSTAGHARMALRARTPPRPTPTHPDPARDRGRDRGAGGGTRG